MGNTLYQILCQFPREVYTAYHFNVRNKWTPYQDKAPSGFKIARNRLAVGGSVVSFGHFEECSTGTAH
jgi:hypothetical protein